jgi:hypothetical protein
MKAKHLTGAVAAISLMSSGVAMAAPHLGMSPHFGGGGFHGAPAFHGGAVHDPTPMAVRPLAARARSWHGHDWDHDGDHDHWWWRGGWPGYWGGFGFWAGYDLAPWWWSYPGAESYDVETAAPEPAAPPGYDCDGWRWDATQGHYVAAKVACN